MATFEHIFFSVMDKLQALYDKWKALQPLNERKQFLLSQRFTVEYNYNSNHIEGNTLTYGQTELLLLFGKVSGEGKLKDFVDMKASLASVKMLEDEMKARAALTQNFIMCYYEKIIPRIANCLTAAKQALPSTQADIKHAPIA